MNDKNKTREQLIDELSELRKRNAELEASAKDTNRLLTDKTVQEKISEHKSLFEDSPLSLWQEDFSIVKNKIDELRKSGISDIESYFSKNPGFVSECAEAVRLVDANPASLKLYKASTKEELLSGLDKLFTTETYEVFREELTAFSKGETRFTKETEQKTLTGETIWTIINISIAPEYEETWSKVYVSITDITERVNIESNLKEKEERFRAIFEQSIDSIVLIDTDTGGFVEFNEATHKRLGYTYEEFRNLTISDIEVIESPEEVKKHIEKIKREGSDVFETRHRTKNGEIRDVLVSIRTIKIEDKVLLIDVWRDITEEKKVKRITELEQTRLYNLLNGLPGFVYLQAPDYSIKFANSTFTELFGEHEEAPCHKVLQDKESPCETCPTFKVFETNKPQMWEWEMPNGSVYQVFDYPFTDIDGSPLVLELGVDITERKEIEENLKESLSLLNASMESTADGLLVVGLDDKTTAYNKKFVEMWRIPDSILSTMDDEKMLEYVLKQLKYPDKFLIKVRELYSRPEAVSFDDIEFKNGKIFERYSQPQMIGERIVGRVWSFRDVTDKRIAEKELIESEEKYRVLTETSPDYIMILDTECKIKYINRTVPELKKENVIDKSIYDLVPEDERRERKELLESVIRTQKPDSYRTERKDSEGSSRYLESRVWPIVLNKKVTGITICSTDITERLKAEQEVKKNVRLLDLIFKHTLDSIVLLDKDYNFIRVSETYAKSCQRDPSEFPGRNHFDMYPSNLKDEIDDFVKTKSIYKRTERPFVFPDHPDWGTTYCDLGLVPILDDKSEIELFLFTLKDVTENKKAELRDKINLMRLEYLLKMHQMGDISLKEIFNYVLDISIILTQSTHGFIGFVSEDEKIFTIHTWSKETMEKCKVIDKPIEFQIDDAGIWAEAVRQRKPVIVNDYESTNLGKKGYPEGHIDLKRLICIPIFQHNRIVALGAVSNKTHEYDNHDLNQMTLLLNSMWQLVERRKSREEINKLSRAVEQSPATIMITDSEGRIEYVNPKFTRVTGYEPEEVIGKTPGILKSGKHSESFYKELWESITSYQVWTGEIVNRKKSGELYYDSTVISPIFGFDGKITNFLAIKEDITEQKHKDKLFLMQTRQAQMGQMLSMIAHQWRQPLAAANSIVNNLKVKVSFDNLDEEYAMTSLNKIESQLQFLSQIITDFSNFFRPDKKKELTTAKKIISKSLNLIERSLLSDNIQIIHSFKENTEIETFANELIQVFLNLFKNSQDIFRERKVENPEILTRRLKRSNVLLIMPHKQFCDVQNI